METEKPIQNMDDIKAIVEYRLKVARMAPELLEGLRLAVKIIAGFSKFLGQKTDGVDELSLLLEKAEEGDPNKNHIPTSSIIMPMTKGFH